MISPRQKTQNIQKTCQFIRLCRVFFADHFGAKTFWISLRYNNVIVIILNTEILGVQRCLQHSLFSEYLYTDHR
jgi:hypothetical protein